MAPKNPKLSLIIPAFNESAIIVRNVHELDDWMRTHLPQLTYEIVVINDGSTDGMPELLEAERSKLPSLRVIHHPTNLGRGRAIRTGMEGTQGDFLIALDADLSYAPHHIETLLAPLLSGKADLTLASPYHPEGSVQNVPGFRAWLSKWGNRVLAYSFQNKYYTSTCVVRGYTRKLIDHLELVSSSKELHLEVLYKAELLDFTITEVPAHLIWRDKKRGRSSKNFVHRIRNNSLLKMRKAILSHLLFNFFSKPKLLFLGPILALLIAFLYGAASLIAVFTTNWLDRHDSERLTTILRETLIEGQLTLTLTVSSLILLVAFLIFLFLASQAKRYFEENYILSARANYRLKVMQRALATCD